MDSIRITYTSEKTFQSFRRYISLSILTSGSYVTKKYVFFNTIHCDVNDCFHGKFQETAIDYLKELEYKYDIEKHYLKRIEYLRRLSNCCKGLAAPITCKYTILEKYAENIKKSSSMHLFL